MSANDIQVGGKHYQSFYQHWDWVIACKMNYLAACATKYVTRWRNKNGLQDLYKAKHYTQKLWEVADLVPNNMMSVSFRAFCLTETKRFVTLNKLEPKESVFCLSLATWRDRDDITFAIQVLDRLIETEEKDIDDACKQAQIPTSKAVPAEDSNKHAERE